MVSSLSPQLAAHQVWCWAAWGERPLSWQKRFPVESDQWGELSAAKSFRDLVHKAQNNVTRQKYLSGFRIARGGLVSPRGSVAPHR